MNELYSFRCISSLPEAVSYILKQVIDHHTKFNQNPVILMIWV